MESENSGGSGLFGQSSLPDDSWDEYWDHIFVPPDLKDRLLSWMRFLLTVRDGLPKVGTGLHGVLVLAGPAGTGKTSLAKGAANQAARACGQVTFAQVDPHVLPSDLLGESQRSVAQLLRVEIPHLSCDGKPVIVLVDEVESLAVTRSGASLSANPVDVHRATDAVLAGLDELALREPGLLILATTNFPEGVDVAFLDRADAVLWVGLPTEDAADAILRDSIEQFSRRWPSLGPLATDPELRAVARLCEGMSGRQVRKVVLEALVVTPQTPATAAGLTIGDLLEAARLRRNAWGTDSARRAAGETSVQDEWQRSGPEASAGRGVRGREVGGSGRRGG